MRLTALPLLVLTILIGCGDSTNPDNGGNWTATLSAPAGVVDGAAIVELRGANIQTISAQDGQVFTQANGDVVRVVVVRDTPGELRFRLQLAKGSDLPRATVIEVADGDDALRPSLTQYSVRFAR